jgi:hypothetical protein
MVPQYNHKIGYLTFSATLPLIYHGLNVHDKQYEVKNQYDYLYLNPTIGLKYVFSALSDIRGSGSYDHSMGDITDFMTSFVMPDYQLTFVDLGFTYKWEKFHFTLNWNNILNQESYGYTLYSGLDIYQYNYRLRPQSVLASIVFKY